MGTQWTHQRRRRWRAIPHSLQLESLERRELLTINFLPGDTNIAPSVNDQEFVAISPGGPGYLAAWTDERAVLSGFVNTSSPIAGSEQDIYGQLLDTDGRPLGEPIVISNLGQNQQKPELAWNESSQSWLVVFDSEDPDWYFNNQTYGVRVDSTGQVLDPDPILLFEQVGNQGYVDADVASDGTNWTIIATKFEQVGSVFGRRMAGDGSLLELMPIKIVGMDLVSPDIAYADNTYMIAAKNRITDNVFVTRVDTSLTNVGTTTLVGSGAYPGPQIAGNQSEFMVVADRAFRITSSGQNLDPGGIPLGGSLSVGAQRDVTWSGNQWSVGMRTLQSDVAVQRIDAAGVLIDAQPIVVNASAMDQQVAIAGNVGESVIVFSDRPGFDQDVRSVHVASDGTASGAIDISVGMARQRNVTTVDGPAGENLVVYVSQTSGQSRLFSQRVADNGSVLDPQPTLIATSVTSQTDFGSPQVAWNGSVYMVTWDNLAKRISASNQVIDLQPIVVSNLPIGAVAAAGDTFVVGVYEYHSFHEPLNYMRFVRVGGDGAVIDTVSQLVATGFVREMTAESFADTAIFAWGQYGRHDGFNGYTQAAIIGADASINGPFRVSIGLGETPDIAVNANQALFVYTDDSTIHEADIKGRFVMADGSIPEWEFPISTAANNQIVPDVGWIGDQYVVAWNDYRHLDSIQQLRSNIRAARVLDDGTVRDPNGFTVTDSVLPADLPSVVGGNGNSWILFSAMHGVNGVPETQRIGYQYGPIVDHVVLPFQHIGIGGGSVTASADNLGVIAFSGESISYEFFVQANERVTAVVTPTDETVTMSAEFAGLGSLVTASAPGAAVIVPLVEVAGGGNVTLNISGDGRTAYTFDLHRNVNLEALDDRGLPVAIDDSRIVVNDASRFTATGRSTGQVGGTGFEHYNDSSLFVDISSTGTPLVLDDGFYGKRAYVNSTVGNDVFPAGTVTIASTGVMLAGADDIYLGSHQPLPDTFYLDGLPALAPFWTLLGANTPPSFLGDGVVYMEERLIDGIETLVVQWHEVPAWHNFGAATFQVQVFASGPVKARFAYEDVTFGNPDLDGGGGASIGAQLDGNTGYQFSFETSALADGDVLDFLDLATIEDNDDFTVDLVAGDTIDVALTGVDRSFSGQIMELRDAAGSVLATGSTSFSGTPITNYEQGIFGYEVFSDGTYTVRVRSQLDAKYSVVVTQDFVLDTEPNSQVPLRTINNTSGAVGFLDRRPDLAGHAQYNDPSLFIDISQTGDALFMDHGDAVSRVVTNIGNVVMPAGKFLVGSDGVLMQDEDIAAFSGYSTQPLPNGYFEFSALVPFWTDLEDETGNVYVDERVVDGVDTLIVQWDMRSYFFQSGTGTFQVQLFGRNPSAENQLVARYVYQDVDFDNALYDGGADATIGLQIDQNTAEMISHRTASIANGDVIDFYVAAGDRYQLDLAAGETITLQTGTPLDDPSDSLANTLDPAIAMMDAAGGILAADANSLDGKNALLTFTAPSNGTYTVSIFAESGMGDYVLNKSIGTTTLDGDFNDDGIYDDTDIDMLTTAISSGGSVSVFDLSGDGQLSIDDVDQWLAEAGNANLGPGVAYLPADANLDGIVDGVDFMIWNSHKFTPHTNWSGGDFNADGVVDGLDFTIWNAHKFTSASAMPRVRKDLAPPTWEATARPQRFGSSDPDADDDTATERDDFFRKLGM